MDDLVTSYSGISEDKSPYKFMDESAQIYADQSSKEDIFYDNYEIDIDDLDDWD